MSMPRNLLAEIQQGKALKKSIGERGHPNLIFADRAIDHVRSTCGILAANRDADQAMWKLKNPELDMDQTYERAQDDVDLNTPKIVKKIPFGTEEIIDPKDKVKAQATYTRQYKVGNCEYQASLAFEYLKEIGAKPLDIVFFAPFENNDRKPVKTLGKAATENVRPDHVFVVIGRPNGTDATTYTTWGNDAVICDPWARRAYFARNLEFESERLGTISAGQIKLILQYRYTG